MCLINVHIPIKYGSSIINFIHECSAQKNNDIHWRNFYQTTLLNVLWIYVKLFSKVSGIQTIRLRRSACVNGLKHWFLHNLHLKTHLRLQADLWYINNSRTCTKIIALKYLYSCKPTFSIWADIHIILMSRYVATTFFTHSCLRVWNHRLDLWCFWQKLGN